MSTCVYCGKQNCRHQDSGRENTAPGCPRSDDRPPVGIGGRGSVSASESRSLFELVELHTLRCVLCDFRIAPGPAQRVQRIGHANIHIKEGRVVAITTGLHDGAVYFEVRHER